MHPTLFSFMGNDIKSAYILWLLSSAVFMLWAAKRGDALYGLNRKALGNAMLSAYLAAAAGALVFGAAESGEPFLSAAAWRGDLSSAGGILAGAAAGLFSAGKNRVGFGAFFDAASVPAAVSIGIWRLGCLFEGCCRWIRASESSIMPITYPGETFARTGSPLCESIYAFLCAALIYAAEKYLLPDNIKGRGALAGSGLVLYAVFRLAADRFREEGLGPWGYAAFCMLAAAGTALILRAFLMRKEVRASE